jgi:hypothetical protein
LVEQCLPAQSINSIVVIIYTLNSTERKDTDLRAVEITSVLTRLFESYTEIKSTKLFGILSFKLLSIFTMFIPYIVLVVCFSFLKNNITVVIVAGVGVIVLKSILITSV